MVLSTPGRVCRESNSDSYKSVCKWVLKAVRCKEFFLFVFISLSLPRSLTPAPPFYLSLYFYLHFLQRVAWQEDSNSYCHFALFCRHQWCTRRQIYDAICQRKKEDSMNESNHMKQLKMTDLLSASVFVSETFGKSGGTQHNFYVFCCIQMYIVSWSLGCWFIWNTETYSIRDA